MNLSDYIHEIKTLPSLRTVTFLIKEDKVLLGYKKKGFGKGYLLGIGGKVEKGETLEECAKREVQEEIGVNLLQLDEKGIMHFYFPHIKDGSWNQKVIVFVCTKWEGKPQESEEIKPEWFDVNHIPYDNMWDDAHYWLPQVLHTKKVKGEFIFNKDLKVIESTIT